MTPADVARAAWSGFSSGEVICLPGLEATDLLQDLASTERAIMGGNMGAGLADRYRD